MSLVVRKIEFGKWKQRNILAGEVPSADAITGSMRTTRNSLSVWSIANSVELEEAVLAIACNLQKTDALDFLIIESVLIKNCGLELDSCGPGPTHYTQFIPKHRDVINLDYQSLGTMANIFIESIRRGYRVRFTSGELKKVLLDGIDSGKIKKDELDPSLVEKLYPPTQN